MYCYDFSFILILLAHIATIFTTDQSFAYGYRGSLLSRLAVASLHLQNYDIAKRCIIERRISHRSSMLPLESAAIVRGLLRCHHSEEAWEVLEDELSLPLEGSVQWETNERNKNEMNDDEIKCFF